MKQNTERLRLLADVIEARPEHFDMSLWYRSKESVNGNPRRVSDADATECGTTFCVAGWACYLWPEDIPRTDSTDGNAWVHAGAAVLGLPRRTAKALFFATGYKAPEMAAILRRIADGQSLRQARAAVDSEKAKADAEASAERRASVLSRLLGRSVVEEAETVVNESMDESGPTQSQPLAPASPSRR